MKIREELVNKLKNHYGDWMIYMRTSITNDDGNDLTYQINVRDQYRR